MEEGPSRINSGSLSGSLVQIDSIAIDISSAMEPPICSAMEPPTCSAMEPPKLENFSIRGFVADMRKKNPKTCLLFGDGDVDVVDDLPPMSVPSFRWWQSLTNVQEDEAQRASEDVGMDSYQCVGDTNALVLHSTENTGKTDLGDINAQNSCNASEANQLQIVEWVDITADTAELGDDGAGSALPPRRKPKLRSLADIMGTERNSTTEVEVVLRAQPEPDVPVYVAKDAVNPERKRKIDLGEDEGRLRMICRKAAGKRIKGLNMDAGRSCGRVEVFESGSEGHASMRSEPKLGARMEPKKTKGLIANKKMRQKTHKEDRTGQTRKPNGESSANLQKCGVPVEINFGKSRGSASTVEERGLFYRSAEKMYTLSKSKIPDVRDDRCPVVIPGKRNLGDSSARGKAVLDLSLDCFADAANDQACHRGIPDLNEEPLEGYMLTTPYKSSPLHKNLEVSRPCRNHALSGGERQNWEKRKEVEAADDIPMDIVELLAKNMRERVVENPRYFPGFNNSVKGYSPLCVEGRPSSSKDYPLNRTSGIPLRNGVGQDIPPVNTYGEDARFWPSSSENAPICRNISQKQSSSTCADSFLNQSRKGKTATDMRGAALNRYPSNEMIPAMQLLSLMDQRVAVRSSFNESCTDKPFSPNHQPWLHEKKHNFVSGKMFSQNRNSGSLRVGNLGRSEAALGPCTLNRNPADFSSPDARNEFTISWKDLKLRKRKNPNDGEGKKGRQRGKNL